MSILFSGCATVLDYNPAVLRFDTPETTGRFLSGNVSLVSGYIAKRVLGSINNSIPSDVNPREYYDSSAEYIETKYTLGSLLDLGMMKNVDVYLVSVLLNSENVLASFAMRSSICNPESYNAVDSLSASSIMFDISSS